MNVGLKYPVYAVYADNTGSVAYSGGAVMAKAISASLSWNKNSAKLYADDGLVAVDNAPQSGTITLGMHQLTSAVRGVLFGHTVTDGVVSVTSNDVAPYVGVGFYGKVLVDSAYKYRAVWLNKVMFGIADEDTATKGETVEFQTPSIEGEIMKDITESLYVQKDFDTEAAAIAYLNAKAGIIAQLAKPVASVASGSYATTQSVTLTALVGSTIYYTVNGTTPSATNGETYSTAISVAASCALRAIAVKSGSSNSEVATYEYIITE